MVIIGEKKKSLKEGISKYESANPYIEVKEFLELIKNNWKNMD